MKNLIIYIFLYATFTVNAQEKEPYWSIHFQSGYNDGPFTRFYTRDFSQYTFSKNGVVLLAQQSFFSFNPSFKKHIKNLYWETGFRNLNLTGLLDQRINDTLSAYNTNVSGGVFFGYNASLLTLKKFRLHLGAEMYYNYYYAFAIRKIGNSITYKSQTTRLKTTEIGLNITPRLNYAISQKFNIEATMPISTLRKARFAGVEETWNGVYSLVSPTRINSEINTQLSPTFMLTFGFILN